MKNAVRIFILLLMGPVIGLISGCGDCQDCLPSGDYPYVKMRFFHIDSLNKIEGQLSILEDSLDEIESLIDSGQTEYLPVRDQLNESIRQLEKTKSDIQSGKIRIDELTGIGADKILYFRDSTSNDSLTLFRFPLNMYEEDARFVIRIATRTDTLSVRYHLASFVNGHSIIRKASNLEVYHFTYDSVRYVCSTDSCNTDESSLYVFF